MKISTLLAACALGAVSTLATAQTSSSNYAQMNTYEQLVGTSTTAAAPANAPLSRAQVRADLARARSDGTIPRFGNPDPYGPGRMARGAPATSAYQMN
jgi:Domain of unknown function (DUF4148)